MTKQTMGGVIVMCSAIMGVLYASTCYHEEKTVKKINHPSGTHSLNGKTHTPAGAPNGCAVTYSDHTVNLNAETGKLDANFGEGQFCDCGSITGDCEVSKDDNAWKKKKT